MAYTDCKIHDNLNPLRSIFERFFNFFITLTIDNFNCAPIVLPGFGDDCQFLTPEDGQTVHIYSSDIGKDSIFFRPAVIYNEATATYVMWVNRIPRGDTVEIGYHDGGYITAHSKSITGPFTILG